MSPAVLARAGDRNRLLWIDPLARSWEHHGVADLPSLLGAGDLLVVNDAATLPASLHGTARGAPVELRLAGPPEEGWAVLFGPGSWRQPTELRLAPPRLERGDRIELLGGAVEVLEVSPLSPRLLRVGIDRSQVLAHGRPVQYSYMLRDLHLHEVQSPYAGRPVAVEMPSAGRPLDLRLRRALHDRGVGIAALTHAAGLSATGDPGLDAALPLPERYEVPRATWDAVQQAERVIAVGTSVVRALESAARGTLKGRTELRIGADTELAVVDGLLSGMHEPGESHFELMAAFADLDLLRAARDDTEGYLNHEFGDSTLVLARAAGLGRALDRHLGDLEAGL